MTSYQKFYPASDHHAIAFQRKAINEDSHTDHDQDNGRLPSASPSKART
jgi:hypothetical protein